MNALPRPAKRAVRQSFGASAPTYDQHAFLQREIGGRLFERLQYIKLAPQRILDIGSGTGYATQRLRERYANAELFALDIAPAMLHFARAKTGSRSLLKRLLRQSPEPIYLCADAEALHWQARASTSRCRTWPCNGAIPNGLPARPREY